MIKCENKEFTMLKNKCYPYPLNLKNLPKSNERM